jgi:hypothetical protein
VKLSLFCLALAAATLSAPAAQVFVEAGNTSGFSYFADPAAANSIPAISSNSQLKLAVANGDDLFTGTVVLIGSFLGFSDNELKSHASDINFLRDNFTQFGSAKIGDGGNPAGTLSGSVTANAGGLAGQQIYLMIVAGTNNSTPSTSFATAFQVGVYYFDKSLDSDWAFPSDSPVPGSTTIDIADLTAGNNGTALVASGAHVVIGGFGPDQSNANPGKINFALAALPVPEPSSVCLLASLGLGLVGLSRRRMG